MTAEKETLQYVVGACDVYMEAEHCSGESKADFQSIKDTLKQVLLPEDKEKE